MTSQTAEYALRAVVWLASQPDQALTTRQISETTKVPADYLSKVLQALARTGLVHSIPGRGGGFRLARAPKRISVLDVINAVDDTQRIRRCPLGLPSHGTNLCPLHRRLDDAMAMVEQAFATSTIAELLAESSTSAPLCEKKSVVTVELVTESAKAPRTRSVRVVARNKKPGSPR
ncbi:MAG: Rrf2 family transcriptional regulator [Planctomycetes bacterium]|nr:Rrf2 family transcriptional regulator [Planctomycetota bacterium]